MASPNTGSFFPQKTRSPHVFPAKPLTLVGSQLEYGGGDTTGLVGSPGVGVGGSYKDLGYSSGWAVRGGGEP